LKVSGFRKGEEPRGLQAKRVHLQAKATCKEKAEQILFLMAERIPLFYYR